MDGRPVVIDCDPGHDDAVAILLALRHLDVLGITTVAGNQTIENVTRNALAVLALAGRADVPVAAGHAAPLASAAGFGTRVHGATGMDGATLPEPVSAPDPRHAVRFIIDTAMAHEGVTLVPLGPLTNIAAALRMEPRLADRVHGISLMGGSFGPGNVTPAAEFNIGFDPEAAHVVFTSGVPIRMCGLNLTRQAAAGDPEIARFRAVGTATGVVVADLVRFYRDRSRALFGSEAVPLHDACAVAALVDPGVITFRPMHVAVELRGEHTRGMTVCDGRFTPGFAAAGVPGPNADVGIEIGRERFFDLVTAALAAHP